jgi:hypothetical protein
LPSIALVRWMRLAIASFTTVLACAGLPRQQSALLISPVAAQVSPSASAQASSSRVLQAPCRPLPAVGGPAVHVTPSQANRLAGIVQSAARGSVILLDDGVYPVTQGLVFRQPNVTIRSASAQRGLSSDPSRVVIDGLSGPGGRAGGENDPRVPELVGVLANDVTIADLTLRNARDHLIHVQTAGADVRNTRIENVRLLDPGEQAIKINTVPGSGTYVDNGEVVCSEIELTDSGRPRVQRQFGDGCYTGGIDAHEARGWKFANNRIKGFWCERGLSEHAIHAWTGSRDTIVEGNEIINSARGIGLGLGEYDGSRWRTYADGACGRSANLGHYRGIVRNNAILANDARLGASRAGFDVGISLESVCQTGVVNNTVFSTVGFRSTAIEWRFASTTDVVIENNLTNGPIRPRNGATGIVRTNVTNAAADWFLSVTGNGDLRLARSIDSVVHRGSFVEDSVRDKDAGSRSPLPDIGAFQYQGR